ncbi:integrin alpha-E-like isoform X1 [Gadus chalcogrammus]|uniref:integrin alpha-E-like isoform X1 n=1 Tax=Gadus chalcogrammus TaxID=1042646 RepID=UPI0024C491FD|nr:integrin alpha-E-like isoform X1 [Gadus chalcogrammus]
MAWAHLLLLTVAWTRPTEGFNIYEKPVTTFKEDNDVLFGQTEAQTKDGVLIPSPNSRVVFVCTLNKGDEGKCAKLTGFTEVEGTKPVVSVTNLMTADNEKTMVCQQQRKMEKCIEYFNANCILQSAFGNTEVLYPATLVVEQLDKINGSINRNNNNNNNNNNNDDDDEEVPGTEIGFVLDGSGSISAPDFAIAKQFICDVMSNVWKKCYNCDFTLVQYGSSVRSELSLKDSKENGQKALEKVKNIQQIGNLTVTASAIQYLLNHSFAFDNGSNPAAKKMMIVVSDGEITEFDRTNLIPALEMLKKMDVTRFAIGVGEIRVKPMAMKEMSDIAGDKKNLKFVDNYNALTSILAQLENNLLSSIEGLNEGDGFKFELSEAGFSSHIAPDESLLFGAVGANDWSGGVILRPPGQPVSFLQAESSKQRFSYLGYSVLSATVPSTAREKQYLYISGAPRYNLTGGVLVFDAANHKQRQLLQGEQLGSYFGSVLCAVDIDQNGETDYLLVGAPFHYQKGEEGKVFLYKLLGEGAFQKEDFEWRGLEKYVFSRFGSAIASVGDLDGNGCTDVAVGAPLEEDGQSGGSGSIYIFNGVSDKLQPLHSQRISPASIGMKLRHFGQSVSAFSKQVDRKRQRHISVGSEGNVTVLETLPILHIKPVLEVLPTKIPFTWREKTGKVTLEIQFKQRDQGEIADTEELQVLYNISLDVDQDKKRLTFVNNSDKVGAFDLKPSVGPQCISLTFSGCNDCYAPIVVQLNFTLKTTANRKPHRVLEYWTPKEVTQKVMIANNCEGSCVANISLSDSKLNQDVVIIGSSKSNSISFNLTNHGDEAYMTKLVLAYPHNLQYSHMTVNNPESTLEGTKCDHELRTPLSEVRCRLLHPHFKKGAQANFVIHWQIVDMKAEMRDGQIHASLTSANQDNQILDKKTYSFTMKNAMTVQLSGTASPNVIPFEDRLKEADITFTFKLSGENKYNATLTVDISLTTFEHNTNMAKPTVEPRDHCKINKKTQGYYDIKCLVTDLKDIRVHTSISDVKETSSKITASANVTIDEDFVLMGVNTTSSKVHVMILKQEVIKSEAAIIGGSIGGFLVLVLFVVLLFKCGFYKKRNQST